MKITDKQLLQLKSFHCERLSNDSDSNFRLIENFSNYRNNRLVETLQNEAYEEDQENRLAYYLVKNDADEIVFFFSLKCGLLYDEFFEGERLQAITAFYKEMVELSKDVSLSEEDRLAVDTILEKARTKKGLKKEEVARVLGLSKEPESFAKVFGKNLKNVGRTFPGVEIVHFCANDETRKIWDAYHFPQSLGTVVFWYFVVPKILDLMEIVGCEYLFLFAADQTADGLLVNFYSEKLGFECRDEHCAAIPMYDFTCQFMSQKTNTLREKQKEFFDHFNPDDEV